jgi:hypothetical protein
MANVLNKQNFTYLTSVNTTLYLDDEWIINPDMSGVEGVDKRYWKIVGNSVVEMSQEEKDAKDASILPSVKQQKMDQIDAKTAKLVSVGFDFDGHTFSLSLAAQQNWTGLQVAISQGYLSEVAFPFEIATLDNGTYDLQWEDAPTFFQNVLSALSTRLAAGRALKKQVEEATTLAEVEAVVDNR